MSSISKLLGEKVKVLRKNAGLTQEQLAEKAEIDLSYLGRIEMGQENPSLKYLNKLATALGVKVPELTDF